jgi:hypothetical protein
MPTVVLADALDAALDAYDDLAALGEDVEDEWSYIQDLTAAWRTRLEEVRAERGTDPLAPDILAALAAASAQIGTVEDPHRAIDWLSTYPQVLLLALGETP